MPSQTLPLPLVFPSPQARFSSQSDSNAPNMRIAGSNEQNCALRHAGIDSSAPALELAESNARLNGWEPTQHTFLKNDIAKYMQQQIAEGSMWDIVVLDPPKLAPNRKSLTRALAKYCKLNTLVSFMTGLPQSGASICFCTKPTGRMLGQCSPITLYGFQLRPWCEDLHLL